MGLDEFLVVTVSIALLVVVVHGVLVARAVLISGLDINPPDRRAVRMRGH